MAKTKETKTETKTEPKKMTRTSKYAKIKEVLNSDVKGLFKRNPRGRMSEEKVNELSEKLSKI